MVAAQPPRNFTHGEIVRWRRVGGLVLAEVAYEPGQRVHRHVHPHARFVLILSSCRPCSRLSTRASARRT